MLGKSRGAFGDCLHAPGFVYSCIDRVRRVVIKDIEILLGAVAQLGERLVRNEEVVGSIPISSTSPPNVWRPERSFVTSRVAPARSRMAGKPGWPYIGMIHLTPKDYLSPLRLSPRIAE